MDLFNELFALTLFTLGMCVFFLAWIERVAHSLLSLVIRVRSYIMGLAKNG